MVLFVHLSLLFHLSGSFFLAFRSLHSLLIFFISWLVKSVFIFLSVFLCLCCVLERDWFFFYINAILLCVCVMGVCVKLLMCCFFFVCWCCLKTLRTLTDIHTENLLQLIAVPVRTLWWWRDKFVVYIFLKNVSPLSERMYLLGTWVVTSIHYECSCLFQQNLCFRCIFCQCEDTCEWSN